MDWLAFLAAGTPQASGMSTGDVVGYVVVPLAIFLLGATGAGIAGLVKFVGYMARSQSAQESTAVSNLEISKKLDSFIFQTNGSVGDLERRVSIVEYARDHGQFRSQASERRHPDGSP
jgi:hypothetical protein